MIPNNTTLNPRVYKMPAVDTHGLLEMGVLFRNVDVTRWVSTMKTTTTTTSVASTNPPGEA
jgi:hypothetical protein